ncbi:MAG TPA: hypothetical protein VKT52_02085 [Ktedonobacterales bacterium]|nr:hypothetical protein [Ktedonobacterales bacterium]
MPIGWWGVLDQARIAAILVVTGAVVYGFVTLLVRGARRAWTKETSSTRPADTPPLGHT